MLIWGMSSTSLQYYHFVNCLVYRELFWGSLFILLMCSKEPFKYELKIKLVNLLKRIKKFPLKINKPKLIGRWLEWVDHPSIIIWIILQMGPQIDLPATTSQSNLMEFKEGKIKMNEGRSELSVFNLQFHQKSIN